MTLTLQTLKEWAGGNYLDSSDKDETLRQFTEPVGLQTAMDSYDRISRSDVRQVATVVGGFLGHIAS